MLSLIQTMTHSLTISVFIFLSLPWFTWAIYQLHTKGWAFFDEIKTYRPLLHASKISESPVENLANPFYFYYTLFCCYIFSLFRTRVGIALLALAGFNASCITPLTPYAIDFLLFLLTNQLYLTLIFWLLPKRRDGIYEKFTKKYIDTLIDNPPTHDAVLHAVIIGSSVTVGTLIEMSSNEKTTQIKIEDYPDKDRRPEGCSQN